MLVAASSVAHAPRPRRTTDHRCNRARSSAVAIPSRSARRHGGHRRRAVEAGPALAGVLPVEIGQHRRGHRHRAFVGEHRHGAAAQPASERSKRFVVERDVEDLPVEQTGEVAAHQGAAHPLFGDPVQGEQFGHRYAMRNLVEPGPAASAGQRRQKRSWRIIGSDFAVRVGAMPLYVRQVRQRLDIADQCRQTADALVERARRFVGRLGWSAVDGTARRRSPRRRRIRGRQCAR